MTPRHQAAACALLLVVSACASGRPMLDYQLGSGERFTLAVSRQQVSDRSFGGNRMVDTTVVRSTDRFQVTAARENAVQLTVEYGERSFEASRSEATAVDFTPLVGQKASFWLASTGEITDFEGFYRLPMIPMPQGGYDGTRYQMELETLFPHVPGELPEPGGTWTHRKELTDASSGSPIDIAMDFRYTLTGPVEGSRDLVEIDCSYTVTITGPVDAGDFFLDLRMDGEGREKIVFDHRRHMLVESTGTMWAEGKAVNDDAGFEALLRDEHVTEIRAAF